MKKELGLTVYWIILFLMFVLDTYFIKSEIFNGKSVTFFGIGLVFSITALFSIFYNYWSRKKNNFFLVIAIEQEEFRKLAVPTQQAWLENRYLAAQLNNCTFLILFLFYLID